MPNTLVKDIDPVEEDVAEVNMLSAICTCSKIMYNHGLKKRSNFSQQRGGCSTTSVYREKCKGEWESSLGGGKCRTKEQYREVTKCVLLAIPDGQNFH